jgi:2-polyprenyl-3-methyl-5-hydroxy-6-metoxy-1,4-benzoquinol methylase
MTLMEMLCLVKDDSIILDYGCAVGMLSCGIKRNGYKNVYGFDISPWASQEASKNGVSVLNDIDDFNCDLLIGLDVFEHMLDSDISDLINKVSPNVILTRIPCSTNGGKSFHLSISNADKTHINCKNKDDWIKMLNDLGYYELRLNLFTIYDTPGVYCSILIRK